MKFSSDEIAFATGGEVIRRAGRGQVSTDTRAVGPGDWFLALVGARFNGHAFLNQAAANGAAGCIVSEAMSSDWVGGCVLVEDTTKALQDLGRFARSQMNGPLIGLTGTTGKTTTRAMIACAIASQFKVHQTHGNLNNHLGVPMTLIGTPDDCDAVVLEMGTSSPGEIAFLAELANPDGRVILNVGAGHLEELGGLDGVAQEKGALFRSAKPGQWVAMNTDDERVRQIAIPDGVKVLSWGQIGKPTVRLCGAKIDGESLQTDAKYETPEGLFSVRLSAPGVHLAHNGACALAVAYALGIPMKAAAASLELYEPVGMRQKIERICEGVRAINDTYNANPVSMMAALDTLAALSGRRIAVLGDMLELGREEGRYHEEIFLHARSLDLDAIVLTGARFGNLKDLGLRCFWFSEPDGAADYLLSYLQSGDQVLFKGSRGSRVERILQTVQAAHIN